MSIATSSSIKDGVILSPTADVSVPFRSLKRPALLNLNLPDKSGHPGNEVFDDISSAEFILESPNSPTNSVFSLHVLLASRREGMISNASVDSMACSESDFIEELLEVKLCQVDDIISIERAHEAHDSQKVKYVSF